MLQSPLPGAERRGRGRERAAPPFGFRGVGPRVTMGKVVSAVSKLRRDRARRLRRDQTEAEAQLWQRLRAGRLEGWKWRRQAPVGPFIVDFLCLEAWLAVELDGGVHVGQVEYDARREAYLMRQGLHVLRFWNAEVSEDPERVSWMILSACRESDPSRRGRQIVRGRRPHPLRA